MRLGRDGIAGLIGLATSLFLLPFSFGLPKLPIVPIGPGFYPALVLVFMALTSLVLVLQDVVAQRRAAPLDAQEPAPAQPKRNYGLVLACLRRRWRSTSRCCRCSAFALPPPCSWRPSRWCWSGRRRLRQWAIQVAIAVGTAAVTYLVFERYLSVILPRGSWTGW